METEVVLVDVTDRFGCVRTIVVWKREKLLKSFNSHTEGCVRTIVVWKRLLKVKVSPAFQLRKNHSGMETKYDMLAITFYNFGCVRTIVVWKLELTW